MSKFLVILFSLLTIFACGRGSNSFIKNELAPVAERLPPTRQSEPNPFDWVTLAPELVYDDIASQWDNPKYLSDDDPLTLRMKFSSDQLYEHLKQNFPERFGSAIPKPEIRIMENDSINGFNSSRPVCYAVKIRFEGAGANADPVSSDDVIEINSKGSIGFYPHSKVACVDRMQTVNPARFAAEYLRNSTRVRDCTITVDGDELVLGKDCKLSVRDQKRGAGGIIIQSIANWITLTTGALRSFPSEREAIFTLYHELGHYYLSHGAVTKSRYNYFYQMNDANRLLARPTEEPQFQDLGKKLLALPSYRTQPIEGQRLHSELYSYLPTAIQNLIRPACQENSCDHKCDAITAFSADIALTAKLGTFPQAQLSPEGRELYFQYEQNLLSCAAQITMTADAPASGESAIDAVKKVFWKGESVAGQTLASSILSMSGMLFAQDEQKNALFQQALEQRIGYYTTEEEADDIALQWLSEMGIAPHHAIDYWLRYFQLHTEKEQDSAYSFGAQQCLDAQAKGWPERSVPVGSFTDAHHSTCFRIYNLVQEIRVQAYPEVSESEDNGDPWIALIGGSNDLTKAEKK